MDTEYAIWTLLVESVKMVLKNRPHKKNVAISISHDFF